MKKYVRATKDTNTGKYKIVLDSLNKYSFIASHPILSDVLGKATCKKTIKLDYNDSIPAGTPFELRYSGANDEIDIFTASHTGGPIVTIDVEELSKYTITVYTNDLGDKVGDLILSQNDKLNDSDVELTKLYNYSSLLYKIEKIFGVNIF